MRKIAYAFVAVLAAGCASSPAARYYTLDMQPSGRPRPQVNVDVDRLRPAEALARRDILVKTSPTQIEYYVSDRWAAGLGELVAEKLEAEFGEDLEARETVVITGTILSFEQVDIAGGAEAHIKLALSFRKEAEGPYAAPFLEKVYELTIPADGADAGAAVKALSRGLEDVADLIASEIAGP